jgi:hypothetical protein
MPTTANHVWRPSAARTLVMDEFVPGPRGVPPRRPAAVWPVKDPSDVLDYQFDIAPALAGNDGDALATLDVVISPSGDGDLNLASSAADGSRAVVWLQGGQAGTTYTITLTMGTQAGRTLSRSVSLQVLSLAAASAGLMFLTTDTGEPLTDEHGNPLVMEL